MEVENNNGGYSYRKPHFLLKKFVIFGIFVASDSLSMLLFLFLFGADNNFDLSANVGKRG